MKRFFDLSLLLLVPMFLIGIYTSDSTTATTTTNALEISEQAIEIHNLISPHIEMSLEDIQQSLNSAATSKASAVCELGCNPANCCYTQRHLNKLITIFGCCEEECGPAVCLDQNGDDCITAADLTGLLANWCQN